MPELPGLATAAKLRAWLARYERELHGSVLPFWLRHAVDRERGGLYTCIRDDGGLITEDKYMWSQLRALWTFSAVHRHLGPRPDCLEVADGIFEFVMAHGRDEAGAWRFALTGAGGELQGANSIYTDGFAIYGLTEYARVTPEAVAAAGPGDAAPQSALAAALATFERIEPLLRAPGSFPSAPYPIPPHLKAHGISMIFSIAFLELGKLLEERGHEAAGRVLDAALWHAEQIMTVFRRPEERLVREFMGLDDRPDASRQGAAVVPGHAIESMWFMLHAYGHLEGRRAGARERIEQAIECIGWHVQLGWDEEYGGLILARDAEGGEPWWPFAHSKLWWPQTEALYALLLAYESSGDPGDLAWFERVDEYAFKHYPVPVHGEWTQKLTREGKPFTSTVALPVKDPFHLPRALLYCILALRRLVGRVEGRT